MNLKHDILEHLPNPKDIILPNYFLQTIGEVKQLSGISNEAIERGKERLRKSYKILKSNSQIAPDYSDFEAYIAYIDSYLEMYYPRMSFILNNLLRYSNFSNSLQNFSGNVIRILDIGAGPATMFMSFINYFNELNQQDSFDFKYEVSLIEGEENFLDFIRLLFKTMNTQNPDLYNKISVKHPIQSQTIDLTDLDNSLNLPLGNETFHIIILSFILNENSPSKENVVELFNILARHLDQNGIIIFIEAPSDYLATYLEFDFQEASNLFRIAPCLNGNQIYGSIKKRDLPFFRPCGDLCTFQVKPEDRNRFSYLVLSKNNMVSTEYDELIQTSIDFYNKYKSLTFLSSRQQRQEKLDKIGRDIIDILGLFSDRRFNDYYFCNGGCKFKIDDYTGRDFNFEEGDLVLFENVKFDGPFVKINYSSRPPIIKKYAELGFKYGENENNEDPSDFTVI